ncbi:MAG: HAD family phosphatase [Patescibacteria group bacterium]
MTKKRVFVFDLDGVLVASEKMWLETETRFLHDIFGDGIANKIGDTVGMSVGEIYKKAVLFGTTFDKGEYDRLCLEAAKRVYSKCPISDGVDELVAYLLKIKWTLALLSGSPMSWIDQVACRLKWKDKLTKIVSLNEHTELRMKPYPDGYQFLIQDLGAQAEDCVALEDSNPGIASAKAAGLYTIGYREHLPVGYEQQGADICVNTMQEIVSMLMFRNQR